MTERLIVVGAVMVMVVVAAVLARRRGTNPVPVKTLANTGLAAGTYLFSSAGCQSCQPVRARLQASGHPFEELSWEEHPEVYARLSIDAVPSTLVVDASGRGRWYRGTAPMPRSARRAH